MSNIFLNKHTETSANFNLPAPIVSTLQAKKVLLESVVLKVSNATITSNLFVEIYPFCKPFNILKLVLSMVLKKHWYAKVEL